MFQALPEAPSETVLSLLEPRQKPFARQIRPSRPMALRLPLVRQRPPQWMRLLRGPLPQQLRQFLRQQLRQRPLHPLR